MSKALANHSIYTMNLRPFASFFFLVMVLISGHARGEKKGAGLQALLDKGKELTQSQPDSAVRIFQLGMTASKKSGEKSLYAEFCYRLGMLHAVRNDFDKALPLADSAEKYRNALPEKRLASLYNLQANIFMQTGRYEQAAGRYLKCLSLAEKQKDNRLLLMVYSNLSMLYLNLIQPEKALDFARKQFNLAKQIRNDDEEGYACMALNDIFSNTHQNDSMEKYVRIMEKTCKSTQDPNLPLMLANASGAMYSGKKQYHQAIPHFLKAMDLNRQMGDSNGMVRSAINVGLAFVKDKKGRNAIIYLEPACKKAAVWGEKMLEREATKELAEAYFLAGDYRKAYKTQLNYQALSDEALSQDINKNIQKLEAQYQTEKKEAEIQRLEKEKALKANEVEKSHHERNMVMITSLSLIGFGFFFGNRILAKRRIAGRQAELENRLRLSANLHDDVGATLSSISIYAEAIKNKLNANETDRIPELVDKIGENARETVATLGDLVWNLNPVNDSAEKLFQRMESTATFLLSAQNTQLEFEVDPSLLEFDFSLEAKQNLYLIFKETINNAAKYARAGVVNARIKKQGNKLEMNIVDNGIGFDLTQTSEGNGLRNIRLRSESLMGTATISSDSNGTLTFVSLPLLALGKM